jgi:hypothetical protein
MSGVDRKDAEAYKHYLSGSPHPVWEFDRPPISHQHVNDSTALGLPKGRTFRKAFVKYNDWISEFR